MNNQEEILWVAHTLFDRKLVTGCTGNISYRTPDGFMMSKSGSCFGTLQADDFIQISLNGEYLEGRPSKEYPLHLSFYKTHPEAQVVIHTHSYYATLFTCKCVSSQEVVRLFKRTPYLKMKTDGHIGWVPYYPPGTKELFEAFDQVVQKDTCLYLMQRHGLIVSGTSALEAFDRIEELDQATQLDHDLMLRRFANS